MHGLLGDAYEISDVAEWIQADFPVQTIIFNSLGYLHQQYRNRQRKG